MVEMDVGQDDVTKVLHGEAVSGEPCFERSEAARRTAVDDGRLLARKEVGRDDPGAPEVIQVEQLRRGRAT